MSRQCFVCGKGLMRGNNVSHANNKTKRVYLPNLQRVRLLVNQQPKRVMVCTGCIKAGITKKVR